MDVYLSTYSDLSSESGSEEPLGNTGANRDRTTPQHQQSASFMAFLRNLGAPEVCRRVLDVLDNENTCIYDDIRVNRPDGPGCI
jgi:hypothetical protein